LRSRSQRRFAAERSSRPAQAPAGRVVDAAELAQARRGFAL